MLLNGLWVSILGGDGGECGVGVGGLERVARWRVHRHGELRHCGSVILACTRVSSFYRRLSQKYQTNRNNKWSLYAVMMVQVRVGDGDSGRRRLGPYEVSNTDVVTTHITCLITKSAASHEGTLLVSQNLGISLDDS